MIRKRGKKRIVSGVAGKSRLKSKAKKKPALSRNKFKQKKPRKAGRKDKSSKVRKLIRLAKARQKVKPKKKRFWIFA